MYSVNLMILSIYFQTHQMAHASFIPLPVVVVASHPPERDRLEPD